MSARPLNCAFDAATSCDALPDGDARYRHLMEQAGDGIFLLTSAFRIAEVNRAAELMLGYAHGTMTGRPVTDFIATEDLQAEPPRLDVLQHGGVILRERTMVRSDGSHIQVEVHTRRIAPGFYFGIARDITARRLLETRLRQAEKLEGIGLLAGGVAHDFNNHLTVIRGHCGLLLDALPMHSEEANDVAAIQLAAERASHITAQLLAFGRRQALQPEVFDLNALIRDLHPMLQRLVGADVIVSTDLLPGPALVRADPVQFERMLINLCSNARDAMPRGGAIELDTTLIPCPRGRQHVREVVLEVRDTGHGMDEATRARIFEPFFTTKAFGAGTGLGLAMVHGIVHQSGGHIECLSAPGRGTTFRLLFDEADGTLTDTGSFRANTNSPRGCETILVVDDDESILHLLSRILGRLGYLVVLARGVGDALAIATEMPAPALLLADLVLTDGTGTALARLLQSSWPSTGTLYMSGYGDEELARRGIEVASLPLLSKPFDTHELAERVRATLDRRDDIRRPGAGATLV